MSLTFTPQTDIGQSMPDFSLPSVVDQKNYSRHWLNTNNFDAVLIMFICNHCPYVKAIEDRLIELTLDLKNHNVNVIGICSNDSSEHTEDSPEQLKKRAEEKSYPFLYLHDESQAVAKAFGAVCTPDFFVYDKNLKLFYRGRLDDNWKDAAKVSKRELYDAVINNLNSQKSSPAQNNTKQIPSMGCNIKWKTENL